MVTNQMIEAARQALMASGHRKADGGVPSSDAVRDALFAAEQASWRPVEEAPSDGKTIMLSDGSQAIIIWPSAMPGRGLVLPRGFKATHWRPIPALP